MTKGFKNTWEICMVSVKDLNREEGFRNVDLGNYFLDENGRRCLITSKRLAEQYAHLVKEPVYCYLDVAKNTTTKL